MEYRGDCNVSGDITINELIVMANVSKALAGCTSGGQGSLYN